MSTPPESIHTGIAAAEAKLARLDAEVEAMQAVLVRLMQDVVLAERRLALDSGAQIVEANAHLIEAALESQAKADAAAQALQRAESAAVLDALTHLPNRHLLADRFAQAAAHARRRGSAHLALLFVDLDGFKRLNDDHGHAFGDEVLRHVARRLTSAVRREDTVSRYGGDEFVVLLTDVQDPLDARAVAGKLVAAIGAPVELAGSAVTVGASIGIALYPEDGVDLDRLVECADADMYRAKRQRADRQATGAEVSGAKTPTRRDAPAPAGGPAAPAAEREGDRLQADRLQADLREANEKLVLAVVSAQELRDAAESARQRQTALLAAVAEELSRPGAPIRLANAMLGRPAADLQPLPHATDIVQRQLAQVSRLVSRVIEASAQGQGPLRPERHRVDLAEILGRAVAAHRPLIAKRAQSLEVQHVDGAVEVIGDAAQLEHVIGNLLDNARTHTPEGGHIRVTLRTAGDTVSLAVEDDGIGITPQTLPHIFEPFVQDTMALGSADIGLGVGLTVARALVEAHGGRLEASSAGVRRGSRFVITLRRAGSATRPDAPGSTAEGATS